MEKIVRQRDSYATALRNCTVTRLKSTLKAFANKKFFQITPFKASHSILWSQLAPKLLKNRKIGCHLFLIVNFHLRSSGMGFMIKKK